MNLLPPAYCFVEPGHIGSDDSLVTCEPPPPVNQLVYPIVRANPEIQDHIDAKFLLAVLKQEIAQYRRLPKYQVVTSLIC